MIKKILIYFIVILIVGVIALFAIPQKKKSFSEYYQEDDAIKKSLIQFRQYPTQKVLYNNKEWEYLSIGTGKKHLLFLHGMGGSYDIWFQQVEALKDSFHIISITLPEVNSLEEASKGILKILKEENIEKLSIIGTSMGGYIAQYFWTKHPDYLEKIVLGNTFPPNDVYEKQNGKIRKVLPFVPEWLIMSEFRKNASKNVVSASENSKLVEAYLLEQYSGIMTKKQFLGRLDIVLEPFEIGKNGEIPVLIIESDNDPLVNENLRRQLKETYRHSQIYTFSKKGHFPYLNNAKDYNSLLLQFFKSAK